MHPKHICRPRGTRSFFTATQDSASLRPGLSYFVPTGLAPFAFQTTDSDAFQATDPSEDKQVLRSLLRMTTCIVQGNKRRVARQCEPRFLSKHGRRGRFPPHPRSRNLRDTAAATIGMPLGCGGRKQFHNYRCSSQNDRPTTLSRVAGASFASGSSLALVHLSIFQIGRASCRERV